MPIAKKSVDHLALLGGEPCFREPLHVGRPNLGDRSRFIRYIERIFDDAWLTNDGPLVRKLEDELAEYLGVEHCIATANGTLALMILIRALGLHGEVVMPSFTFVATPHSVSWSGLTPVFAEIEQHTHNIDPLSVEMLITPETSAILGVHLWGRPGAVESLQKTASDHGIPLLFDAAHAFGCSSGATPIGSIGTASAFSFHATKHFNTMEGGAVTTNDADLAAVLRRMRNFGFTDYDKVTQLGINAKMTEVSAAMGLVNLESVPFFTEQSEANYEMYQQQLPPELTLLPYDPADSPNYRYIVAEMHDSSLTRDDLVKLLWAENVLARRYFFPGCHRLAPYGSLGQIGSLPITEAVADRVIVLPTGTAVTRATVREVCDLISFCINNAEVLHAQLSE